MNLEKAEKDFFDVESEWEKGLSTEKYIPNLVGKYINLGFIGVGDLAGYLWTKDVETGCAFAKPTETFNYGGFKKFLGNNREYLVIYENTMFHLGKRGLALCEDRIILFEKEEIILYEDICECKFNPSDISLVIKGKKGLFKFEYRFSGQIYYGAKICAPLGQTMSEIVYRSIKHYQELRDIHLLKEFSRGDFNG